MKNSRKQKKRRKENDKVQVTISLLRSNEGDSNSKEKHKGGSLQKKATPFHFEHDTDYTTLVKMIATQLHVDHSCSLEVSQWNLLLGGKHMLEDSSEIEDGDHLVLDCGGCSKGGSDGHTGTETNNQSIHEEYDDSEEEESYLGSDYLGSLNMDVNPDESGSEREWEWEWESDMECVNTKSSSMRNKTFVILTDGEDSGDSNDDIDDDDDEVEDVTDKYKAAMDSKKNKLLRQAEFLSDDDDENESSQSREEFGNRSRNFGNQMIPGKGPKNKRKIKNEISASSKSSSKRRKNQPTTKRRRKSSNKEKNPSESHIQVIMEDKDIPPAPGRPHQPDEDISSSMGFTAASTVSPNGKNTGTSDAIKNRIMKLLNTGFHSNSNEHEAKNAMKLARRLMERHNLSQALLLQEHADSQSKQSAEGELKGGMVTVKVVNRKTGEPMGCMVRWVAYLIHPVCLNFKVEAYKTVSRKRSWTAGECSVTFYGIYTNAQLAGYAFKIACERISLMSASYCVSEKGADARAAKLSYALGIVEGLTEDIRETKRREEAKRKEKLERARRAVRTGEVYAESDFDESDTELADRDETVTGGRAFGSGSIGKPGGDNTPKLDEKGRVIQPGNSSTNEDEFYNGQESTIDKERLETLEKEESAALVLTEHHKKIAKDVLKEANVKVYTSAKRKQLSLNHRAYKKGVEDSKEIDLDQRALRDSADRVKSEIRTRSG